MLILNLITILYIIPSLICIIYFLSLKLYHRNKNNDKYIYNRIFDYILTILVCLIPLFNILLLFIIIDITVRTILKLFKKPRDWFSGLLLNIKII